MAIAIIVLLTICALSTATFATIICLLYARLQGMNLLRVRFEIEQLWKRRNKVKQGRPTGV